MHKRKYERQIGYIAEQAIKLNPNDPGYETRELANNFKWDDTVLEHANNLERAKADFADLSGSEYESSIFWWAIDYDVADKIKELQGKMLAP